MSERWTKLGVTFYNSPIQFQRPEGLEDEQWEMRVKRLECAIRHGVEKMAYFGHYKDENEGKNDLPHDITKNLSDVPAGLIRSGAVAEEEVGDDELEEHKAERERAINQFVFELAENVAIISASGGVATELLKSALNFSDMPLSAIVRKGKALNERRRRAFTTTENGQEVMGISRGRSVCDNGKDRS